MKDVTQQQLQDMAQIVVNLVLKHHIKANDKNLNNIDDVPCFKVTDDARDKINEILGTSYGYDLEGYDSQRLVLQRARTITGIGVLASTAVIIALPAIMGLTPFIFIPIALAIACVAGYAVSAFKLDILESRHANFCFDMANASVNVMVAVLNSTGTTANFGFAECFRYGPGQDLFKIPAQSLKITYSDGSERSLL